MMIDEKALLKDGERIDDLQCNGFKIIQNPSYFCFGMDAVLLANFVNVKPKAKVMDLGTGNGIIPTLLCAKKKGVDFTGLEIQEDIAEMANRTAKLNDVSEILRVINGDIKEIKTSFAHGSFDVVTSNPPYINGGSGLHNPELPLNIARHEILVSLEDVIKGAAHLLKEGGSFAIIHKPFRLPEIISLMKQYRLEPKRMQMVQPYSDKEPNMVMIEATKGGKPMLKVLPTLVVYNKDQSYTDELLAYYEGKSSR